MRVPTVTCYTDLESREGKKEKKVQIYPLLERNDAITIMRDQRRDQIKVGSLSVVRTERPCTVESTFNGKSFSQFKAITWLATT